jgi:hypothetical protein
MSTFSTSSTYTVADVAKVVDKFTADLLMIAQATGAMTVQAARLAAADVKLMAQRGYINRVDIVLHNAAGTTVRAAAYRASEDASGWSSDRPGNNLWPRSPNGGLAVVAFFTTTWWALTEAQRQAFLINECGDKWGPSSIDTSYGGMVGRYDRRYASNGYGLERTVYEGD